MVQEQCELLIGNRCSILVPLPLHPHRLPESDCHRVPSFTISVPADETRILKVVIALSDDLIDGKKSTLHQSVTKSSQLWKLVPSVDSTLSFTVVRFDRLISETKVVSCFLVPNLTIHERLLVPIETVKLFVEKFIPDDSSDQKHMSIHRSDPQQLGFESFCSPVLGNPLEIFFGETVVGELSNLLVSNVILGDVAERHSDRTIHRHLCLNSKDSSFSTVKDLSDSTRSLTVENEGKSTCFVPMMNSERAFFVALEHLLRGWRHPPELLWRVSLVSRRTLATIRGSRLSLSLSSHVSLINWLRPYSIRIDVDDIEDLLPNDNLSELEVIGDGQLDTELIVNRFSNLTSLEVSDDIDLRWRDEVFSSLSTLKMATSTSLRLAMPDRLPSLTDHLMIYSRNDVPTRLVLNEFVDHLDLYGVTLSLTGKTVGTLGVENAEVAIECGWIEKLIASNIDGHIRSDIGDLHVCEPMVDLVVDGRVSRVFLDEPRATVNVVHDRFFDDGDVCVLPLERVDDLFLGCREPSSTESFALVLRYDPTRWMRTRFEFDVKRLRLCRCVTCVPVFVGAELVIEDCETRTRECR